MPRIPYVEREAVSGKLKELYDSFESQFQTQGIPNVVKTPANILELTGATAFWNMMARNLNALQVGLEN